MSLDEADRVQHMESRGDVVFFVPGIPIPQGSMISLGGGAMRSANKKLRSWRKSVAMIAAGAFKGRMLSKETAVFLGVTFVLERPRTVKRMDHTVPPDLDKLIRAVFDSVKGIAWVDDSQVTHVEANKRYGTDRYGSNPGAHVLICPVSTYRGHWSTQWIK